jgi:lipopolysaccharide biosynthesis glycosyltransferase
MSQENNIYVTYLSNDRDYKGVLLLNYNLKKYNHNFNLSCIVLENVSSKVKNILFKSNIILHEFILKDILADFKIYNDFCNHIINNHYYGKFLIFKLTNYDKIIYLDTDLLIKQNIDHLFSYDFNNRIYMTYDVSTNDNSALLFKKHMFNSGVILTKPSLEIYNHCYSTMKLYENKISDLGTDQTILNLLNQQNIINVCYLDFKYNYLSTFGDIYTKNLIIKDEPIIIHFILNPKPWQIIDFDESVLDMYLYSNSKIFVEQWINLYYEMVNQLVYKLNSKMCYKEFNDIFLVDKNSKEQVSFL